VRFTFHVDQQYVGRAATIAQEFIGTYLPEGDRTKYRSIIIRTGDIYFAVWGSMAHVRVYQEQTK
jgi:hypothetical protein